MEYRLKSIFYMLSIFVLGTALFVLQPSDSPEVTVWQDEIKQQMAVAFEQTWGDQPVLDELALVYESVTEFYMQSSDAFIALVQNEELDADIAFVYHQVYLSFAEAIQMGEPKVAGEFDIQIDSEKFMTEEPLYDIAPAVAGMSLSLEDVKTPVNVHNPWFTAIDAYTGQVYCMAIYNGEINKYLGECQYDEYN